MLVDRRSLMAGGLAAALLAPAAPANAIVPDQWQSLMRQVMGLRWKGTSRTPNADYEGGVFETAVGMAFTLNSDWTYEGLLKEILNLQGQVYVGYFKISGECWVLGGKDAGLSVSRMSFMEGTPLPNDIAWSTSKGEFRFFNDSQRSGHFALEGALIDDVDRTRFEVKMVDF